MIRIQERRTAARLSAITAASALATVAALAAAAPAMADDGVQATYKGMASGQTNTVKLKGHGEDDIPAGLMNLQVKGSGAPTLSVYCIDLKNPVGPGDQYAEGKWDDTWLGTRADDGGKVKWILLNSYPTKTVEQLKAATGASGLNESEAGAATQAAIWHFSDHADLDPGDKKNDPDIKKVYDWLIQNAKVEPGEGTKFSLSLEKDDVSGKPSDNPGVGPFTVKTTAGGKDITAKVKDAPAGTKLVGKDGKEITGKVGNGDELYVKPPADSKKGEATFEVSGSSSVDVGRVFKGIRNGQSVASQLLILAGSTPVKVTADGKAKWATSGPLPAFTADEKCAEGGVEITATNKGDEDFTFTLDGKQTVVAKNGGTVKQLVKVAEDQKYDIKIVGPDNKVLKEFTGVVDCKPASTTGGGGTPPTTAPAASPAPSGPELAKTGGNGSDSTLYLTGGAVLLLGGGLVFFVVRRRTAQ
ncbi:MAG: Cys-Gln thioester bond-forming surface protein [Streptomycetaceae bacterium]|nr:Cys-Gln thioester bond-forming surface protein [Streptomycetaceae bacterium]